MEALQHTTSRRIEMHSKSNSHLGIRDSLPRCYSPTANLCGLPSFSVRQTPRQKQLQGAWSILCSLCHAIPCYMDSNLWPSRGSFPPKADWQRRWHHASPKNWHWNCALSFDYGRFWFGWRAEKNLTSYNAKTIIYVWLLASPSTCTCWAVRGFQLHWPNWTLL